MPTINKAVARWTPKLDDLLILLSYRDSTWTRPSGILRYHFGVVYVDFPHLDRLFEALHRGCHEVDILVVGGVPPNDDCAELLSRLAKNVHAAKVDDLFLLTEVTLDVRIIRSFYLYSEDVRPFRLAAVISAEGPPYFYRWFSVGRSSNYVDYVDQREGSSKIVRASVDTSAPASAEKTAKETPALPPLPAEKTAKETPSPPNIPEEQTVKDTSPLRESGAKEDVQWVTVKYPDGTLHKRFQIKNNLRHGIYVGHNPDGSVKVRRGYYKGVRHGLEMRVNFYDQVCSLPVDYTTTEYDHGVAVERSARRVQHKF